ncbi:MAG: response regulator [Immundisolibacteraceae bacterium]|nr:response regulator [Immundisolibacteraceae bacterium]
MDLNLPDMDGNEVLARLKGNLSTKNIPVIIVTADATKGLGDQLMLAGAQGYLTKPFSLDLFLTTIDMALEPTLSQGLGPEL